jgi:hypothetical protein
MEGIQDPADGGMSRCGSRIYIGLLNKKGDVRDSRIRVFASRGGCPDYREEMSNLGVRLLFFWDSTEDEKEARRQ